MKEGDRVRVKVREVTPDDRKAGLYEHMLGKTGIVENVYNEAEIAVRLDLAGLDDVQRAVHTEATRRMRDKFVEQASEDAKKSLSKDELEFVPNFVVLVRASDLEKV